MIEQIKKHYSDELEDIISYSKMVGELTEPGERGIIRDIAKEEHDHSRMLKHILERSGNYNPSEELKQKERQAEDAFNRI